MNIRATTQDAAPATRELNDFLLELGLALQRYALYPGGHPSIDAAVAELVAGLGALLVDREVLSLGVARRQLIVDGVATEDTHPVLRAVAERLHRHRVGVISFHRGLGRDELSSALRAVSADPDRTGVTLGLLGADEQAQWPHVRFHALAYDHLQLAASESGEESGSGGSGLSGQLWLGLARAALARDQVDANAEPGQVAQAINERAGARAYDQVVVGYMLQLTDELQRESGAPADPVRSRLSQVVKRLEPETLDRLLEMGGDVPQRARFLHGAVRGLQADAVLELVNAAARAEGQTISTSLLRLLRKLSVAAHNPPAHLSDADAQLREQVRDLLVGWSLTDPNPGAYTAVLETMARTAPDGAGARAAHPAEALRMVQMSLELGTIGPAVLRAADTLVASGRTAELLQAIETAGDSAASGALWTRIELSDALRIALTTDPVELDDVEPVLRRLPASGLVSLLLDRLSESDSRATRMTLLRRLAAVGLPSIPAAAERLDDPRWYVQRNMLVLLNELRAWPPSRSVLPYVTHADERVRREGVQAALRVTAERSQAIRAALADADEKVVRLGIGAAREHGLPADAVAVALDRADDDTLDAELRALLVRLVAPHASTVIDRLLPMVLLPRTLLRGARLAPVSARMLAALGCLAASGTTDARVVRALTLARASKDPRIQRAVTRSA